MIPGRDTKYACWNDPDTPLERMRGSVWERALKKEEKIVGEALKDAKSEIEHYKDAYKKTETDVKPYKYSLGGGIIDVTFHNRFSLSWSWAGSATATEVRDVIVSPCAGYVLSIEDDSPGGEDYTLTVYSAKTRRMVWFSPHVGEHVGVVDGLVYYTKIENRLWNSSVVCCDLESGRNQRNCGLPRAKPRQNYGIERASDGVLYISLEDSQDFCWWRVLKNGKLSVSVAGPGTIPQSWIKPAGHDYGIDCVWNSMKLLVTKSHGSKTLWACSARTPAKKIMEIPAGTIKFDPDTFYSEQSTPHVISFAVFRPDAHVTHYRLVGENMHLVRVGKASGNGVVCERHKARSEDGTVVHYILAHAKSVAKPTRLLITSYGAYGMETPVAMLKERWGPLMEKGWAVAVGFIRGGGDHTADWGRAGRRSGRVKTFEDMEAVIRASQKVCHVGSDQSCIYGRSAGGYLVGALLGRNPEGALFKAVYTEVPYVDVLQTTTNPSLPLTRIEYGEFGHPGASLADFIFAGLTSPATTAAAIPCPAIFVLARTALHDTQVYPYETIKWIRRLRANDECSGLSKTAGKYTIVESGQGHFTPPDVQAVQRGIDAGLIERFFSNAVRK